MRARPAFGLTVGPFEAFGPTSLPLLHSDCNYSGCTTANQPHAYTAGRRLAWRAGCDSAAQMRPKTDRHADGLPACQTGGRAAPI